MLNCCLRPSGSFVVFGLMGWWFGSSMSLMIHVDCQSLRRMSNPPVHSALVLLLLDEWPATMELPKLCSAAPENVHVLDYSCNSAWPSIQLDSAIASPWIAAMHWSSRQIPLQLSTALALLRLSNVSLRALEHPWCSSSMSTMSGWQVVMSTVQ